MPGGAEMQEVAPETEEKDPCAQFVYPVEPLAPPSFEKEPTGTIVQTVAIVIAA